MNHIFLLFIIHLREINLTQPLDEHRMLMALTPDMLVMDALHELLFMREMRLRIITQFFDEIHDAVILIRDQLIVQQIIRLIRELEQLLLERAPEGETTCT